MTAMGIGKATSPANMRQPVRKLLSIETHFTLEAIRERQLEHSITCKDLGGFFEHVWTVHPFATLLTSEGWGPRHGTPSSYEIAPRHTFIEGKVGRFDSLRFLFPLNFLLGQIELFRRLRRLVRSERISVVRVSSPLYEGLFGLLLARLCRIPLVVRVGANHDKHFESTGRPIEPRLMRSRKIEKLVERFVLRRADLVAGANQDNLDFALASGARSERATLFRYGNLIDKRHFAEPDERPATAEALAKWGLELDKFLLYVGRLEPIKRPGDVLEVLKRLRGSGHDVKGVLAGDGRMRSELRDLARELGIEHAVLFAGNLAQGDLAALYPAAAVVVSPHTGRALTEAALGGAPVVAYDVDWQRELIEDRVTGLLVPNGNVGRLADGAAELLGSRDHARSLGRALRARALALFDPQELDENERRQYARLIEQGESG